VTTYSVEVDGLGSLIRALSVELEPALSTLTKAVALEAQDRIAPYPPATEANSPSNASGRWYERDYGPKWRRKDGSIEGRKTSEMLGKRWTIADAPQQSTLTNTASYSNVVHSAEDQAKFHGARGWRTDKDVAQELESDGTAQRMTDAAVEQALRKVGL
jgi:hypothetical protein